MTEMDALIRIAMVTFVCDDPSSARPNKYFAKPPYKPFPMNDEFPDGSHGIYNAHGVNCLTFANKPGAVSTGKQNAFEIAERWNA